MERDGIEQELSPVTHEELRDFGVDLTRHWPNLQVKDLRQYPVLSEGGWFLVIKDRKTLVEVCRRPWRLLGPVELLSHRLDPS